MKEVKVSKNGKMLMILRNYHTLILFIENSGDQKLSVT